MGFSMTGASHVLLGANRVIFTPASVSKMLVVGSAPNKKVNLINFGNQANYSSLEKNKVKLAPFISSNSRLHKSREAFLPKRRFYSTESPRNNNHWYMKIIKLYEESFVSELKKRVSAEWERNSLKKEKQDIIWYIFIKQTIEAIELEFDEFEFFYDTRQHNPAKMEKWTAGGKPIPPLFQWSNTQWPITYGSYSIADVIEYKRSKRWLHYLENLDKPAADNIMMSQFATLLKCINDENQKSKIDKKDFAEGIAKIFTFLSRLCFFEGVALYRFNYSCLSRKNNKVVKILMHNVIIPDNLGDTCRDK